MCGLIVIMLKEETSGKKLDLGICFCLCPLCFFLSCVVIRDEGLKNGKKKPPSSLKQAPIHPPANFTPGLLYLHSLQVLALEGHFCLMVHGDDQRARGQELGAVVLLGESKAGEVKYFSSQSIVLTTVLYLSGWLTMWARMIPSSGLGEASRHS